MPTHHTLHTELEKLNIELLTMGVVEDRARKAVTVIESHDGELITSIIESDYQIDDMEVEIEEDCLKILALHGSQGNIVEKKGWVVMVAAQDGERQGDLPQLAA